MWYLVSDPPKAGIEPFHQSPVAVRPPSPSPPWCPWPSSTTFRPRRVWIDWGHSSFRATCYASMSPKSGLVRFVRRFSSFSANLGKWLPPSADPAGHRHRLVGYLEAHALASALGTARFGHSVTLRSYKPSRQSFILPVGIRSRTAGLETK